MLAVLILCSTSISQTLINVFSGICMYVCMQCTSMLTVSHYVERSVCAKKTWECKGKVSDSTRWVIIAFPQQTAADGNGIAAVVRESAIRLCLIWSGLKDCSPLCSPWHGERHHNSQHSLSLSEHWLEIASITVPYPSFIKSCCTHRVWVVYAF